MLLWRAPKRDDDGEAGVPKGSWLRSWPGRGDQANSGDLNMARPFMDPGCVEVFKNRDAVRVRTWVLAVPL
jgi:hypothetical protein